MGRTIGRWRLRPGEPVASGAMEISPGLNPRYPRPANDPIAEADDAAAAVGSIDEPDAR